ncbi:sugar ABC transporter substrate-binding protein [Yoonia sp. BS5-3]|uniref:Sugar ABC transporter substrate-binding protein n=1 Tax=Yoonia phaeophyticola TaxID=3137369 RepID=A0ABZ2V081_9RHOB
MKNFVSIAALTATVATVPAVTNAAELTIATVNNGHMITMQQLAPEFLERYPNITLNWVTFNEGELREQVTADITEGGGQFDVMTIGMYEAPIWGERGWLAPLNFSAEYEQNDLLPAIRDGLSHEGTLYAAPFYGESSMIMYRSDLMRDAGITLGSNPNWDEVIAAAEAMTDRDNGVYGICLRGKPGWGDNMAFLTTMANSFGAQLFDENWRPTLESDEWRDAVSLYIDTLTKYGPPGSEGNSFNEILSLFNEGRCGMWIDATIAASFITDPDQSSVADDVAFAQAPSGVTNKGANWLWAWALAVPAGSNATVEATTFIEWATSQAYIELVGEKRGWGQVPTGTRQSTYRNANFQDAALFADAELNAILSADPTDSTLNPSPYVGVQFASIPEFADIGGYMGQQMTAALRGDLSIDEALANAQAYADAAMQEAGYY